MTAKPLNAHLWDRDPHDWYIEPESATRQLLEHEAFPGWTHDPCCGQGNIVTTLIAAGCMATGSDLVQRVVAPWHMGVADFLDGQLGAFGADNIVFNPPYYNAKGCERAIRRALAVTTGKVAAFVDARFIFGAARARGLYASHPPSAIYILGNRPSCPPGTYLQAGGKAAGGKHNFVWLVWSADRDGAARMVWVAK